jgi:hypothetical protein
MDGFLRSGDNDGTLERLNFDYRAATPATTFREPSKVMQAQREAAQAAHSAA